jgi:hypothetical protein
MQGIGPGRRHSRRGDANWLQGCRSPLQRVTEHNASLFRIQRSGAQEAHDTCIITEELQVRFVFCDVAHALTHGVYQTRIHCLRLHHVD